MQLDILISLIGLAIAASWTPGPNNALVASSGARFGFQKTVPHILGIVIGFPFMIFCIAIGLGQLFQRSAVLRDIVWIGGTILLLWIAWKTAMASSTAKGEAAGTPFTFLQGAAFQWVNPKAWVMAIAVSAQFVTESEPAKTAIIISSVFFNRRIRVSQRLDYVWRHHATLAESPLRLRVFNVTMALSIVLSVVLILQADRA